MLASRFRVLIALFVLFVLAVSPTLAQDTTPTPISGTQIVLSVDLKPADIKTDDVKSAAQVVARRLEALNIHPYVVQVLNGKAIQVQFPTTSDVQSVISTLTQTALVEVVDFSGLTDQAVSFVGSTVITTAWKANPNLPLRDDGQMNPLTGKPFETILTGSDFTSVRSGQNSNGDWDIEFLLTHDAGQKFGDFTEAHVGEALGIVLDGRVLSTPVLQARLDTGGVIAGNFTEDEAKQLAAEISAGALSLPLSMTSMQTIEAVTVDY